MNGIEFFAQYGIAGLALAGVLGLAYYLARNNKQNNNKQNDLSKNDLSKLIENNTEAVENNTEAVKQLNTLLQVNFARLEGKTDELLARARERRSD